MVDRSLVMPDDNVLDSTKTSEAKSLEGDELLLFESFDTPSHSPVPLRKESLKRDLQARLSVVGGKRLRRRAFRVVGAVVLNRDKALCVAQQLVGVLVLGNALPGCSSSPLC